MKNKKIILGITGSIASFRVPDFALKVVNIGADLSVILTDYAQNFITPVVINTINNNKTYTNESNLTQPMLHIELARMADVILIMPATAHVIAKLANGFCDDLLSTVCVATKAPIILVPAMNHVMWANSIVQENITKLQNHGVEIWGPISGTQMCREQGIGNMMASNDIINKLIDVLS